MKKLEEVLKPGALVHWVDSLGTSGYTLVTDQINYFIQTDPKIGGYQVESDWDGGHSHAVMSYKEWVNTSKITHVWRSNLGDNFPDLAYIMQCIDGEADDWIVWEYKSEVKEMTVDEISKELGYPVKVIGNKEVLHG